MPCFRTMQWFAAAVAVAAVCGCAAAALTDHVDPFIGTGGAGFGIGGCVYVAACFVFGCFFVSV